MSSISSPQMDPQRGDLRVTLYDKVSGWLMALLVLVGLAFSILFGIWLTTVLKFKRVAPPIEYIEYEGRGDHAEGFERDREPPGLEELEEIREPSLESTLEAVTDLASTQAAAFDAMETSSTITGKGGGKGDSRRPGPLGEGRNVIPPWERWEIRYSTTSVSLYARQLDSFGIELGAAGGAPQVDYASNLARAKPTTRQGPPTEEQRIYMTWKSGKLREFDELLLKKAGVNTANRVLMQFYSKELVHSMEALEFQNSNGRRPEEWFKTIFGVRATGGAFEFYVIEQFFRKAPK